MAVTADTVWVTNAQDGTVSAIDACLHLSLAPLQKQQPRAYEFFALLGLLPAGLPEVLESENHRPCRS